MLKRTPVLRGLMSQIHVYVHVHVCDIVHRGLMSQIHVHVYVCDISPVKVKQATSSYRQYFYYQIQMYLHVHVYICVCTLGLQQIVVFGVPNIHLVLTSKYPDIHLLSMKCCNLFRVKY